jgi:hypothetical protein
MVRQISVLLEEDPDPLASGDAGSVRADAWASRQRQAQH